MRARFAYAQARLQSRYGARASTGDWSRLNAARTPAQFLQLASTTSLRQWAEPVKADIDIHRLERTLRAAWTASVEEIATWVPEAWGPAVLKWSELPDVSAREYLRRTGEPAAWMNGDARFDSIEESTATTPRAHDGEAEPTAGEQWLSLWRTTWPALARADVAAIDAIATRLFGTFHPGGSQVDRGQRFRPARAVLEDSLEQAFRRKAGGPVAVMAYLGLLLIDFERFRGGLLARTLFAPTAVRSVA